MLSRPFGFAGRRPVLPQTPAAFKAQTGFDVATAGGLYLFDEASGNLIDHSGGGNDLTVAGAPTFGQIANGHKGIDYPTTTAGHAANKHDVGASTSFIFACVCNFTNAVFLSTIWGMYDAGASVALLYFTAANTLTWRTVSNANIVAIDLGAPTKDGVSYFVGGQVDRSTSATRALFARRGKATKATPGSSAGMTTFTENFGTAPALAAAVGVHHDYGIVLTGAQCEGATKLDALAASLGFMG